jgi:hypothetical protein
VNGEVCQPFAGRQRHRESLIRNVDPPTPKESGQPNISFAIASTIPQEPNTPKYVVRCGSDDAVPHSEQPLFQTIRHLALHQTHFAKVSPIALD